MIRHVLVAFAVLFASSSLAQTGAAHSDVDLESDAEELAGEIATESELIAFGENLRRLIMKEDVQGLKKCLKYGAGGPNDFYDRKTIYKKLDDKASWLYKRLFVGSGSARAFFKRNGKVDVSLSGSGAYYVVSYVSADGREKYDCSFLVYKKDGKIYIGYFPICPACGGGIFWGNSLAAMVEPSMRVERRPPRFSQAIMRRQASHPPLRSKEPIVLHLVFC